MKLSILKFTKSAFTILLVFWVDILYSQTAEAGSDKEICTDTISMTAIAPDFGYTGTWLIIEGNCSVSDFHDPKAFLSNIIVGITTLKWTVSDGTNSSEDFVTITNNTVTKAALPETDESCSETYNLLGNIYGLGETGLWSVVSGYGNIVSPSVYSTQVTNLSSGENSFMWTLSKGICSSSDTIIVTNNTVEAFAGNDTTICTDFVYLNAQNPLPSTGQWSVIASESLPQIQNVILFNTNVTDLGFGTNTFKWEVFKGGCTDYDIVTVYSDKPTDADAGNDTIVCADFTSLNANNPVNGTAYWSSENIDITFNNVNSYNSTVNNLSPGDNILKWTITSGSCSSSDQVTVNYNYIYVDAGADSIICSSNYTLTGNLPANGTGIWSVAGGNGVFDNSASFNTNVSSLLEGENTFKWQINYNGCSAEDFVVIRNDGPSVAEAGLNQEICGFETEIEAVIPEVGSGFWSVVSGSGIFQNSLSVKTSVSYIGLNQNIYRWNVYEGFCSSFDDITVTNNFVTASAGPDQTICGSTAQLSASLPDIYSSGLWTVTAGSGTFSDNLSNSTSVTNIAYGLSKYLWTISKGICSAADEMSVTNNLYPVNASVLGLENICTDYAQISGSTPPVGASGYWTIVEGHGIFDNSAYPNTYFRNLQVGTNTAKWTINKNGCLNSDNVSVFRNTVFADAGQDTSVCGPSAILRANEQPLDVICSWTLLSGGGTFVSATSNVTQVNGVYPGINTYRWSVSGSGCSDYDDVIVINNEFLVSAGINKHICTTSTSLTGTNPSPGNGVWSVQSGYGVFSNPTYYTTTVSDMQSNSVNTFRWEVTKNGCTFYDDVIIYMDKVIADAGNDTVVCNNVAQLNANNPWPGTGTWSLLGGGGTIENTALYNTQIKNLALGPNTLRWTTQNTSCISYDDVTIQNNFVNVTAGADIETCFSTVQLSADEPDTDGYGVWSVYSGNAVFASPSLNTSFASDLSRGENILMWTVFQNGCNNGGNLVSVTNKSFDANAGTDQNLDYFVTNSTFEAELPLGATGIWTVIAGSGNVLDRYSPISDVIDMPTGVNTFKWEVDYNGCKASDNMNIYVFNFIPNAGTDRTVCDTITKLSAQDQSDDQYWQVVEGNGDFDDIYDPGTYVRNIADGLNTYRWNVNLNGALAFDEINIFKAYSNAGTDQNLCSDSALLNGNIPLFDWSGTWVKMGGDAIIQNNSAYNSKITQLSPGQNTFRWIIDAGDCVSEDDVSIYNDIVDVNAGSDQYVTNSFTNMNAELPENSSGTWYLTSGYGEIEQADNPFSYVYNLNLGNNVFKWEINKNGCISLDEVIIEYGYSEIEDIQNQISVFPNPSSGEFIISFGKIMAETKIYVFDISGKIILNKLYTNSENININMNNLENGLFFIKIFADDKYFLKNIIINK